MCYMLSVERVHLLITQRISLNTYNSHLLLRRIHLIEAVGFVRPAHRVVFIDKLFSIRSEVQWMECIEHDGKLFCLFCANTFLHCAWMGAMGESTRVQGE